jgi:hypothetical protein
MVPKGNVLIRLRLSSQLTVTKYLQDINKVIGHYLVILIFICYSQNVNSPSLRVLLEKFGV